MLKLFLLTSLGISTILLLMATFPSLRSVRKSRGGTLREYSEALGISEGQLSKIERGLAPEIGVTLALRIRDLYGIPVEAWDDGRKLGSQHLVEAVAENPPPQDLPQTDPTAGLRRKRSVA